MRVIVFGLSSDVLNADLIIAFGVLCCKWRVKTCIYEIGIEARDFEKVVDSKNKLIH